MSIFSKQHLPRRIIIRLSFLFPLGFALSQRSTAFPGRMIKTNYQAPLKAIVLLVQGYRFPSGSIRLGIMGLRTFRLSTLRVQQLKAF